VTDNWAAPARATHLPEVVREKFLDIPNQDFAPVVRIQQLIFEDAVVNEASDIHIEPRDAITIVRFRINGLMKQMLEVPRWMHDSLVARIKILAGLDITERRIPQDGHIGAQGPGDPDIRVSVLPSRAGEKVVLRLLRKTSVPRSLPDLDLPVAVEETLRALIHRPQGIILVVGPTGSGKTTTLYAMVNEICQEPLNIVTIEDPVEYEIERLTQVQVNDKTGLTFPRALRAILRQDPDVILVGEIRDCETARTAFEATMTGHLVLATLHTTDCVSAVARLTELGVPRELIASGTAAIVAQRLVRTNCPACGEQDFPNPSFLKRFGIEDEQISFQHGCGCGCCDFTGVAGRVGIYEIMESTAEIRSSLLSGGESEIRRTLKNSGVRSLTEQAIERAKEGTISVAEAYRTCYFGGVNG
jgi:type II secretory ATPase GspE/PulE/Tfp pilus assembly ATPase PilB-like protein